MKKGSATIDVTGLPEFAFGNRGLMWWGVVGFLAIETTMLVTCFASYFYLRDRATDWPPPPTLLPDLLIPTVNLGLLLLSVVPIHLVSRAARRLDKRRALIWMTVGITMGIAFVAIRALEFRALNVSWDTNAYGSIVWLIIGVHTFHLASEVVETIVITLILAKGHTEPKYFVDLTDNALYWYFIVAIWIPCYVIVFLAPRFL
ncbi:MAG TPA: cytochrome c oxidase subunit 3 [Pyrinomonadaceae bacterium]|jgi:heme/copper-type cytochrome/quinol oxidase subunit 3|nr:cytochrome c oxidase subunit 3 [Pyrinomonadaceae bacterium]